MWLPTTQILQSGFSFTMATGMACSIMEIFLLFCIWRDLSEPALLPWGLCLCLFRENVSCTDLKVSSHLNCIVKPRGMLPLVVPVRELMRLDRSGQRYHWPFSIAGSAGSSPSQFLEHSSFLHFSTVFTEGFSPFLTGTEGNKCQTASPTSRWLTKCVSGMCYHCTTNQVRCSVSKTLKKITLNEFTVFGIAFVFGVRNKALNASVISTIFFHFIRHTELNYKYSVQIPLVSLSYFFVYQLSVNG